MSVRDFSDAGEQTASERQYDRGINLTGWWDFINQDEFPIKLSTWVDAELKTNGGAAVNALQGTAEEKDWIKRIGIFLDRTGLRRIIKAEDFLSLMFEQETDIPTPAGKITITPKIPSPTLAVALAMYMPGQSIRPDADPNIMNFGYYGIRRGAMAWRRNHSRLETVELPSEELQELCREALGKIKNKISSLQNSNSGALENGDIEPVQMQEKRKGDLERKIANITALGLSDESEIIQLRRIIGNSQQSPAGTLTKAGANQITQGSTDHRV